MVDKTLTQIITFVQNELYQVAGVSVQIYSQGLLAQKVQACFQLLHDDREWKRFQTYEVYTLDGTTGRVVETVADTFKTFEDIYRIFPGESEQPLVLFTSERNPSRQNGNQPLQYAPDTTNVFKVIPATSTGEITVMGRIGYTDDFALDEIVPFDYLALGYMTAWQYAVDEGSNTGMADKFKALFDTRIKQLKFNQEQEPIALNGNRGQIPYQWYTWD